MPHPSTQTAAALRRGSIEADTLSEDMASLLLTPTDYMSSSQDSVVPSRAKSSRARMERLNTGELKQRKRDHHQRWQKEALAEEGSSLLGSIFRTAYVLVHAVVVTVWSILVLIGRGVRSVIG